jgi:hypothetical protein
VDGAGADTLRCWSALERDMTAASTATTACSHSRAPHTHTHLPLPPAACLLLAAHAWHARDGACTPSPAPLFAFLVMLHTYCPATLHATWSTARLQPRCLLVCACARAVRRAP